MAVRLDLNKQFLLTVPNEMADQINNFWHEERLDNRNDAIRELIKLGLEAHNKKVEQGRGK